MNGHGTWLALVLLGAFHGLNPAMGWLFAVALGLQEGSRGGVARALAPIALGHALSIAVVVAGLGVAQRVISPATLQWAAAGTLIVFGLHAIVRRRGHRRWTGMRVGFRDLALWSFLMSSAHGAGLMLVPVLLRMPRGLGGAAFGVHTVAMVAVMGSVALVVYEVLGLELLRRAWLNLDLLWAVALVGAGVATLVV